jgi:hypothetical protein
MSPRRLAAVLPAEHGSPEWRATLALVRDVAELRSPADPDGWADEWLRASYDASDLRALGYCRTCGQKIELRQFGRCVYSSPCGHYRAQGDLKRMQPYIATRGARITPERRASLLKIIGISSTPDAGSAGAGFTPARESTMDEHITIGDQVIYTDPRGQDHDALITNAFSTGNVITPSNSINVAYVSDDSSRTDQYGRQLERETSVQHQSVQTAHGRFWRFAGEEKKQDSAPSMAHAAAE